MTSSTQDDAGEVFRLERIWPGILWLGVAILGAALAFHDGIVELVTAWQQPEYSHGPLIPVISGYLFLRQLKQVSPSAGPVRDRWPGVLVMLLALAMGLVGQLAGFEEVIAYALIVWIAGVILTSFGWARGRQFWPPVVHLVFMLPLPGVIYYKTSLALQLISSEIGVEIVRGFGIPVFLDGNIIDLGVYKLQVAEACSGLRYIFPIMSFTYIFAVLYQGPVWIKAVLLLAALPLAILMNSIRIGVIGVMVDARGIEAAEGFMHLFEGWVIFLLCIGMMILLARLMQVLTRDRRSLTETLDLDMSGIGTQLARVGDIRPSAALIGGTLVIGTAGALMSAAPQLGLAREAAQVDRTPFALFPDELEGWHSGPRKKLTERVERALGADDYIVANYRNVDHAATVNLYVAWYRDQTDGGTHSPAICIPGGGWEIDDIERIDLDVAAPGRPITMRLNRIVIRNGMQLQLAYYWYEQRGRRLASDFAAKGYLLWDSLRTGRSDGALVRLVTPVRPGESLDVAEERLNAFLGTVMPVLTSYIESDWPAAPAD